MILPALRLDDSRAPAPRHSGITSTWLRHREVLAHLRVDPKTLRARMAENPDHIAPPWINVGSAGRPDYRWVAENLDSWWMELNRWRASTNETANGACASVIPMARRGAANAPPRPPPRRSSARSKTPSPSDGDGSLATLVSKRISERS